MTNEEKEELKKKWVEALRSGKYKQGQRRLRSLYDEYCCLGVLADIMEPQGWDEKRRDCYDHKKFGTASIINFPWGEANQAKLIQMNDNMAIHFKEIADWIEENL